MIGYNKVLPMNLFHLLSNFETHSIRVEFIVNGILNVRALAVNQLFLI